MCGIFYGKLSAASDALALQKARGLDGVGIVFPNLAISRFFSPNATLANYQASLKEESDANPDDPFIFMHHRKGSVGALSMDNVHPFAKDGFALMQNGTDHAIRDWGTLEMIPADKTDSECLLHYLVTKGRTFDHMVELLDHLSNCAVKIGVVAIADKATGACLVYSDALRSLAVDWHTVDGKQYLTRMASLNIHGAEFDTKGHIVFELSTGMILVNKLVDVNKPKPSKVRSTIPWNGFQSSGYGTSTYVPKVDPVPEFDRTVPQEAQTEEQKLAVIKDIGNGAFRVLDANGEWWYVKPWDVNLTQRYGIQIHPGYSDADKARYRTMFGASYIQAKDFANFAEECFVVLPANPAPVTPPPATPTYTKSVTGMDSMTNPRLRAVFEAFPKNGEFDLFIAGEKDPFVFSKLDSRYAIYASMSQDELERLDTTFKGIRDDWTLDMQDDKVLTKIWAIRASTQDIDSYYQNLFLI